MFKFFLLIAFISISFIAPTTSYGQNTVLSGPIFRGSTVYGGPGGNYFSDQPRGDCSLYAIKIRAGLYIDSIQAIYMTQSGEQPQVQHGGHGGIEHTFHLNPGEYIQRIDIRYGRFVDAIKFYTNFRQSSFYGGPGGSTLISIPRPENCPNCRAIGFHGRSGTLLDAIGIIWIE